MKPSETTQKEQATTQKLYLLHFYGIINKMPNRKHTTSPSKKLAQKIRTHKNKILKYQRLLSGKGSAKLPTPAQEKLWKAKLDYSLKQLGN